MCGTGWCGCRLRRSSIELGGGLQNAGRWVRYAGPWRPWGCVRQLAGPHHADLVRRLRQCACPAVRRAHRGEPGRVFRPRSRRGAGRDSGEPSSLGAARDHGRAPASHLRVRGSRGSRTATTGARGPGCVLATSRLTIVPEQPGRRALAAPAACAGKSLSRRRGGVGERSSVDALHRPAAPSLGPCAGGARERGGSVCRHRAVVGGVSEKHMYTERAIIARLGQDLPGGAEAANSNVLYLGTSTCRALGLPATCAWASRKPRREVAVIERAARISQRLSSQWRLVRSWGSLRGGPELGE